MHSLQTYSAVALLAATCIVGTPNSVVAQTAASSAAGAEAYVRGLYDRLVASGMDLRDPVRDKGVLHLDLEQLYQREQTTHPDSPGIGVSLCNCQEGPVRSVRVRAVKADPGRAEVEAAMTVAGTPRVLRLVVVTDPMVSPSGSWRIADIQEWTDPARPWSLRRALALSIAATPGPVRPEHTVGRWAGADCRRDYTDWSWDGTTLRFAAASGRVDAERWVGTLPDGFATEAPGAGGRPAVRWEYRFTYNAVKIRNMATGRSFTLRPCI